MWFSIFDHLLVLWLIKIPLSTFRRMLWAHRHDQCPGRKTLQQKNPLEVTSRHLFLFNPYMCRFTCTQMPSVASHTAWEQCCLQQQLSCPLSQAAPWSPQDPPAPRFNLNDLLFLKMANLFCALLPSPKQELSTLRPNYVLMAPSWSPKLSSIPSVQFSTLLLLI